VALLSETENLDVRPRSPIDVPAAISTEQAANGTADTDNSRGFDAAAELSKLPDEARMTHSDLAKKLHLKAEALRKRLDRWRAENGSGWEQVNEREARRPQYVYYVGAIRHVLNAAISSANASG
jgi:hypothetical protein